jgi:hypothetical protein
MCFSAQASFTSAAVISAIGVATLRKVNNPSQKLFSAIPLFFAFQQFAEGALWLTIKSGGYETARIAATYIFLFMALVAWPFLIPLSVRKMEGDSERKRKITWFLFAGGFLSLYYLFCLFRFHVNPVINGFHVQYVNDFPMTLGYIAFGIYILVTIGPLFISSTRYVYIFGILTFVSCFITGIFYQEYLTSVWCFFAAVMSLVIYYIVSKSEQVEEIILKEA